MHFVQEYEGQKVQRGISEYMPDTTSLDGQGMDRWGTWSTWPILCFGVHGLRGSLRCFVDLKSNLALLLNKSNNFLSVFQSNNVQ